MPGKEDRLIIDTNLWISFLVTRDFTSLDSILESKLLVLVFSQELLDEFLEVSQRPKFRKYFSLVDLEYLLIRIKERANFIQIVTIVEICRDPKDNFLLALSKDAKATHLITGDKDLLQIKKFDKTSIITLTEYFEEK